MVTCHHGNLNLVDYLLHTGANVEFQNADGRTRWVGTAYTALLISHHYIQVITLHHAHTCMHQVEGF